MAESNNGAAIPMRKFLNMLKSLNFIDGHQLPELSKAQQRAFIGDPVAYFTRANDAQAAAIYRELTRPRNGG